MFMTNKLLVACIFILLTLFSCKKDYKQVTTFPEVTQEGKNTFGCYISTDKFIAGTTLFGLVIPLSVQYYTDSTNIYKSGSLFIEGIDARSTLSYSGMIAIQKMGVFSTGVYPLTYVANCNKQYACDASFYYNDKLGKNFFADTGELVITKLDTLNKIVSGTFHFSAKDSSGVTKEITNGRFDAVYTH